MWLHSTWSLDLLWTFQARLWSQWSNSQCCSAPRLDWKADSWHWAHRFVSCEGRNTWECTRRLWRSLGRWRHLALYPPLWLVAWLLWCPRSRPLAHRHTLMSDSAQSWSSEWSSSSKAAFAFSRSLVSWWRRLATRMHRWALVKVLGCPPEAFASFVRLSRVVYRYATLAKSRSLTLIWSRPAMCWWSHRRRRTFGGNRTFYRQHW